MKKNLIKTFRCELCGKDFTELSPIHEARCVCLDCYKKMNEEVFDKGKEIMPMKKLKKIVNQK